MRKTSREEKTEMENHVSKSVQIKANLSREKLKYRPFPTNEFSDIYSQIAVNNVTFYCQKNLNTICTISCNLIKSQKFTKSYEIESYELPLQSFELKTIETGSYKCIRFNPNWFSINSLAEELIFSIKKFDETEFNENCDFMLNIHFR